MNVAGLYLAALGIAHRSAACDPDQDGSLPRGHVQSAYVRSIWRQSAVDGEHRPAQGHEWGE
jgi:hypothetical protein